MRVFVTVSSVTTNMVVSHEETDDDAEETKDKKGNGECDLFNGGFVVDGVRGSHHDILV